MSDTINKKLNENEMKFALEEYKSLRSEISNKMNNQYKILSLGIGGITVLFGAIMKTGINELFIALPFLVIANAFLYRIEYMAMINAGIYIKKIENYIYSNPSTSDDTNKMGWENCINRDVYKPFNYVGDIIFLSLYILSTLKVDYYFYSSNMLCDKNQKIVAIMIYTIIMVILLSKYLHLAIKSHKYINNEYDSGKKQKNQKAIRDNRSID